jgi:hypothetical protein
MLWRHREALFCLNLKVACGANLKSIYLRSKTRFQKVQQ